RNFIGLVLSEHLEFRLWSFAGWRDDLPVVFRRRDLPRVNPSASERAIHLPGGLLKRRAFHCVGGIVARVNDGHSVTLFSVQGLPAQRRAVAEDYFTNGLFQIEPLSAAAAHQTAGSPAQLRQNGGSCDLSVLQSVNHQLLILIANVLDA